MHSINQSRFLLATMLLVKKLQNCKMSSSLYMRRFCQLLKCLRSSNILNRLYVSFQLGRVMAKTDLSKLSNMYICLLFYWISPNVMQMNDCLQYLVNRTEAFLEHAQEQQCQKMALQFILDEAKKELLRTEVSTSDTKPKPTKPTTQRRKSSSSGSPVRRRIARRGSAGHPDDEIEPEVQLLRNLGISLPAEAAKDQLRIEALERALLDRASKLEGHANSLQSSTESTISSNLLDAHATLHLLRDSLLALSPYHSVKLFDPEAESSITALEEDVQKLEQELEKVDLQKLQVRNVHREQLVQRWLR
jgi:hypothetical protein